VSLESILETPLTHPSLFIELWLTIAAIAAKVQRARDVSRLLPARFFLPIWCTQLPQIIRMEIG